MRSSHRVRQSEPFHRLPELMARLPLPSEAWARFRESLPDPVHRALALRHRLPRPSAKQVFAAVVPAGLMLGWLASYAVDPEIMQRGGKPYLERAEDGVDIQMPRLAYQSDGYPEDPAPFGYGNSPYGEAPRAEYLNAGIAEAGQYAEAAALDASDAGARPVADGQVLGDGDAPAAAPAAQPAGPQVSAAQDSTAARPVIRVVPQDAPL